MDRRWIAIGLVFVTVIASWIGIQRGRFPLLNIATKPPQIKASLGDVDSPGDEDLVATAELLASASDGRLATAYVFLSTHCPISNRYIPTLNRLYKEYSTEGIQIIGVYPGRQVTLPVAERHREEYEIAFPTVQDQRHNLCRRLGATHTPQAIVVDASGVIVYSGRIDDRFADLGRKRLSVHHADLQEALNSLVGGREIKTPRTPVVGCVIETANMPVSPSVEVTYCRDVAPILFDHCVNCHRPGEVAPFPLLTYDDAIEHAEQMCVVTERRLMPPWKPEPDFGHFQNDRRISNDDIDTLRSWVDQGKPYGKVADLPPRPEFVRGWHLGQPDLVLEMPEEFTVPADGPDLYQHFVIPTELTENRLIRAFEFRPGAPEVVHHSIVYYDVRGEARKLDAADPAPGYRSIGTPGFAASGSLGGWAPGGHPRELPWGMGRPLMKHADIVLQIHYHPSGKATRDRSKLGLYFAHESAKWEVTEGGVSNVDLVIPAGAKRHLHRASFTLPVETLILDATPHMHLLGKEIRAVAHPPQGPTVPLIWIKDWDFNGQDHYVYEEPIRLPAGTRIELECWFDNSADNPLNPNVPPKTVYWGDFSYDEMAICYFQMTTQTWDDFLLLAKAIQTNFDTQFARYQQRKRKRESR